jgi:hypothetical protein
MTRLAVAASTKPNIRNNQKQNALKKTKAKRMKSPRKLKNNTRKTNILSQMAFTRKLILKTEMCLTKLT